MEDNEDKKPPKNQYIIGTDLEEHSVEALENLVNELRSEIDRVEMAISRKSAGRKAAESLFKR